MTTTKAGLAAAIPAELRAALDELLLSLADDEFVIGFSDSEWTGIAPILEEDVAISSLAQDELGHARALYEQLAALRGDGRDADAIAYDRDPADYRHARLLDHPRGDWAQTIARRWLYDTADDVRLASLVDTGYTPLAELLAKVRREERYHLMHMNAWLERLAGTPGEPRRRLEAALERLSADAATVFTPFAAEPLLLEAGAMRVGMGDLEAEWRRRIEPVLERHGLPVPPPAADPARGRLDHSDEFRRLHTDFTSVRRLDPTATW
jgi:ring-1,2-phenylacetyl-CoA epoxidase subunit PaaC